jgi:hypothetical protein
VEERLELSDYFPYAVHRLNGTIAVPLAIPHDGCPGCRQARAVTAARTMLIAVMRLAGHQPMVHVDRDFDIDIQCGDCSFAVTGRVEPDIDGRKVAVLSSRIVPLCGLVPAAEREKVSL